MQIGLGQRTQTLIERITAARAAALDEITAARMAELDAANMPADIDTLLARLTAARASNLDNLDALVSSRSSHSPTDVRQSVCSGTDPANSIGKALYELYVNRITATRAGYLDNLSGGPVALASVCTDARLSELDAANMPADIDTLLARLTATRAGYLDNLVGTQTTGTYSHPSGTTESDAVVITPAELSKYEKLVLDLSGLAQTTTVRTYIQVDGVNYRLIDVAEFPTDFPTNAEGVVIELTPSSRTMKVTLQSAVAEGVAVDVPYFYVERSLT
jgi:hypothetical protein